MASVVLETLKLELATRAMVQYWISSFVDHCSISTLNLLRKTLLITTVVPDYYICAVKSRFTDLLSFSIASALISHYFTGKECALSYYTDDACYSPYSWTIIAAMVFYIACFSTGEGTALMDCRKWDQGAKPSNLI